MKNTETKYLKQKPSGTWLFQMHVPKHLKNHPECIGKAVYTKSLGTKELKQAKRQRDILLSMFDSFREASAAQRFRQEVQRLEEANAEHWLYLKERGELPGDAEGLEATPYDVELDALEREAYRQHRLPLDSDLLPDDLKMRREALAHAGHRDSGREVKPPPEYMDTLREVAERTAKHKEQLGQKPSSIEKYKAAVDNFLDMHRWKDAPITKIKRKHVTEFIRWAQGEKAGKTVAGYIGCLSEVWKTARDEELVEGENPFRGHKVKQDSETRKLWTPEQIRDLYQLTKHPTDARKKRTADEDALLLKIGLYTGARIGEIHALRPEDIGYREGEGGKQILSFHFSAQRTGKNKQGKNDASPRFVPVHPELEADLKEFKGFSGKTDHASKRFGYLKKKYLGEDNTPALCFHSLRHFVSTSLYRSGFDPYFTRFITGHSRNVAGSTELERTYIHGPEYQKLADAIYSIKPIPLEAPEDEGESGLTY